MIERKYKIGEQFILDLSISEWKHKEKCHGKLVVITEYQQDSVYEYIVRGVNEVLNADDGRFGAREEYLIPNTKLHRAIHEV